MKLLSSPITQKGIEELQREFGSYVKITADIKDQQLIVGCALHADGEKVLLEKGSNQDNIWGGGLNLKDKVVDTTAVLNLRPRMNNDSMEILDPERRDKFIELVKSLFANLWH